VDGDSRKGLSGKKGRHRALLKCRISGKGLLGNIYTSEEKRIEPKFADTLSMLKKEEEIFKIKKMKS